MAGLRRELGLAQATSVNMIDMVGIGPFITLSLIVADMGGPQCILAWVLGAILALLDGAVWAELGAKWPAAGGSYAFLQNLYGPRGWGRYFAFLFIWQTTIQAPLVIASGAIGFAKYTSYLYPLTAWEAKAVSGGLVILLVVLLYRSVKTVGNISIVLGLITAGTLVWLIVSAIPDFQISQAFGYAPGAFTLNGEFFTSLGHASQKTVYCYLGYYNVCHLGSEIRNPEKVIPRSIFLSIGGIAVLYLCMQLAVLGVLPWQRIATSEFVVSLYFEHIYGSTIAQIATGLILVNALSSLFAVILGYSRVLYAAAADGNYFAPFARLHPKYNFPHISLLVLGGLAFAFSLLFKMKEVIASIIALRILVQFVAQTVGVILWHYQKPDELRPFRMYLFPLVPLLSIAIWLFILVKSDWLYIAAALGLIVTGTIVYALTLAKKPLPALPNP